MKLKKEYIIPGAIILILLAYLIFGTGKNRMRYEIPQLNPIPSGEIDKIEITQTSKTITLTGKGKTWSIQPQGFRADATKVEKMLESIENLALSELATEKQDYQRYDLTEDKKINVKAYKGDKLLREFDIGKIPSTYRHTFVHIKDDTRVYYARESFRSNFAYEIKDLRDKVVMEFDRNEITGLKIEQEDTTYEFTKKMIAVEPAPEMKKEQTEEETEPETPVPTEEEAWVLPDGKQGEKGEIDAIISELAELKCDNFMAKRRLDDLQNPIYIVTAKGGKDYTLQIFAKQEKKGGKYPAVSSENSYPFLLPVYQAEQIMKKPAELVKKEKGESGQE